MVEMVKNEITNAFKKISEEHSLNMQNIRVKIVKNGNDLVYTIHNQKEFMANTTLSNMMGSYIALAASFKLKTAIKKIILENKLTDDNSCIKLYLLPDNTPSAYLYENNNPIKHIDIATLLN